MEITFKKNSALILSFLFLMTGNSLVHAGNSKFKLLQDDKQDKNSEYSSVFCFRLKVNDDRSNGGTNFQIKDDPNGSDIYNIKYTSGMNTYGEPVRVPCDVKNQVISSDNMIYFSAKPGNYNILGIGTTGSSGNGTQIYEIQINGGVHIDAGRIYYLGEINLSMSWKGQVLNDSIKISDPDSTLKLLKSDLSAKYPHTYFQYKNDIVPVTLGPIIQPKAMETFFKDDFDGKTSQWNQQDDSTGKSYFEDGHLKVESRSENTPAAQWITLPKPLGESFEIELKATWLSGSNDAFGLLIGDNKHNNNYMFGISGNGYAGIWFWYAGYSLKASNKRLIGNLIPWKQVTSFNPDGKGSNTIKVEVIRGTIFYYVNDQLVARDPVNKYYINSGDYTHFLYPYNNSVGVFSFGVQSVRFEELKYSKLK